MQYSYYPNNTSITEETGIKFQTITNNPCITDIDKISQKIELVELYIRFRIQKNTYPLTNIQ